MVTDKPLRPRSCAGPIRAGVRRRDISRHCTSVCGYLLITGLHDSAGCSGAPRLCSSRVQPCPVHPCPIPHATVTLFTHPVPVPVRSWHTHHLQRWSSDMACHNVLQPNASAGSLWVAFDLGLVRPVLRATVQSMEVRWWAKDRAHSHNAHPRCTPP